MAVPSTAPALPRPAEAVRAEFPILAHRTHGREIAYLDSGATAQKPEAVIAAIDHYLRDQNANVHRGVYELSETATALYEGARKRVAAFLGAQTREIVFTRNVTEAINLVAHSWGRANLSPGDRIVLTEMEHHSNIVPWQLIAAERGAEIDWVSVDETGRLDLDELDGLLERGPRLVAVGHISNVLGTVNPVAEITRRAHAAGALVLIDGAQAAPKLPVDVTEIGADFYGFTGHKLYGPTGIGVLWGRAELLDAMEPFNGGGSMIRTVDKTGSTWAEVPTKFEAGTPPIAEAAGLAAAIDWLDELGVEAAHAHEMTISDYLLGRLGEVPHLRVFGPGPAPDRVGIASFELEGVHPHDVAEIVNRHAVCVRAGHHCAQPLMRRLGVGATTRASLAVYNDREDVDRLIDALADARRIFG